MASLVLFIILSGYPRQGSTRCLFDESPTIDGSYVNQNFNLWSSGACKQCSAYSPSTCSQRFYEFECKYGLRWCASLFKLNDDGRHIVGAKTLCGVQVGRAIYIHHHFNDGGKPLISTIVYCIF